MFLNHKVNREQWNVHLTQWGSFHLSLSLSLFSSRCKKDEKMVNQFWKQKLKSCIIVVIVQVDVDVAIVSVALCGTPLQVKRHSVIFQLLFLR